MKSAALHALMSLHTLIVAACFAAGPVMAQRSLQSRWDWLFWTAFILPPAIALLRMLTGRVCILQTWAKRLRGIETGWARDMYIFNEKWAMRVVKIGAVSYVSGLIIALIKVGLNT